MSRQLLFYLSLLLFHAGYLFAVVAPGENLLINGSFTADQRLYPPFWEVSNRQLAIFAETGGPDGRPAMILRAPIDQTGSVTVRQYNLKLLAGETYKISAWVKTKDFVSNHYGVIVLTNSWTAAFGLQKWPQTTDGWQFLEQTFQPTESSGQVYGCALFAQKFSGEVWVADIKLEAISERALAEGVAPPLDYEVNRMRLVAWEPLLNKIPLSDPRLTWHTFGSFTPETLQELDAVFTLDGREWQKQPLQAKLNVVPLAGVAAGEHQLEAKIVKRDTGETIFSQSEVITLIEVPPVDTSNHRRHNNFVTDILQQKLTAQLAEQSFSFDNPRDGWVYIAVQAPAQAAYLSVKVADLGEVINHTTDRQETFRHLPMGRHQLTVAGAAAGGQVIVRAITEIFTYPIGQNSQVPQNTPYDWDFHVKHVFQAVTTLNGGRIAEKNRPELKRRGLRWLGSVGTSTHKDVDDLLQRLQECGGLNLPQYDGVTCDEQAFASTKIISYVQGIRKYDNPHDRLIYTWVVDRPFLQGLHQDSISASLNASHGRGILLYEAYCHTKDSEQEANEYLQDRIVGTMDKFNEYFPNAAAGSGIIFGNFNQMPIITLDANPEVDYKYYLDMQLNLVANHPSFRNLATTGYWGSYYGDEEMYRWSFALLRHYCVEGKTNMLSESFGYQYQPGHLQNCDFRQGLDKWTVAAANDASIRPGSFSGYGRRAQRRWGAPAGTGDTFCLFIRQQGQPNTISQMVTGLVPGKVYTLQFVTADYQDMLQKRFNPRKHGIKATLGDGAEVIPEKGYVFIDRRNSRKKLNDGQARVNLHHLRFRASTTNMQVIFSDEDAEPGEELALNFIMLKPYFE